MMSGLSLTPPVGSPFLYADSILSEGLLKDGKISTSTAPNSGPSLLSNLSESSAPRFPLFSMSGLSSDWPSSGHMTTSEPITMMKGMYNAMIGLHSMPISGTRVKISSI